MSDNSAFVDVHFRLRGQRLPLDHGYSLYGAISRKVSAAHEVQNWGIHPVYGRRHQPGYLELIDASRLKFRLPADDIPAILPLAGQQLDVDGHKVNVGVPEVHALEPSSGLKSRYVTIKGFMEPEGFGEAVGRQLEKRCGVTSDDVQIEVGDRRVMDVSKYTIVGFQLELYGLGSEDSLKVQRNGIGGRRKMGAGIFRPASREKGDG